MADAEYTKDSNLRSILKGLTWRVVATTTTALIAYFITGKVDLALKIGAIEVVAKIGIYYFHERLWLLVPRGTIRSVYKKEKGECKEYAETT
jgi:uncharacterized membrane protein